MQMMVPASGDTQDDERAWARLIAEAIRTDWHDAGMYARADFDPRWLDALAGVTAQAAAGAVVAALTHPDEVASQIDALDASDPEAAHGAADDILLAHVHPHIAASYHRLVGRAGWWAGA